MPCFRGEESLFPLMEKISKLQVGQTSDGGLSWRVSEVLLVWDAGSERLSTTIAKLCEGYEITRGVWLTQNFGQHAATLAGIKKTSGKWVATIDEDGQHDPAEISLLLDKARETSKLLIYGKDSSFSRESRLRNFASKVSKTFVARLLGIPSAIDFQSFRLIDGALGRAVSSQSGPATYLDVALSWFVGEPAVADTLNIGASSRPSGYSLRKLTSHFWMLTTTAGPRAIRVLSYLGIVSSLIGLLLSLYFSIQTLSGAAVPEGWTSQISVSLITSGLILVILGLIAEYISQIHGAILGRPKFYEATRPFPPNLENPHSHESARRGDSAE